MRLTPAAALTCFASSRLFAWVYLWRVHPMTGHVYSDMATYVRGARAFSRAASAYGEVFHAPGTAAYFGLLHRLDPSWGAAIGAQWLVCALIPVLAAALAFEAFGAASAWIALALASLYFPFVDYAGYFLSENPFTLALLLSVWLLARALRARPPAAAAWGFAAGLAGGAAFSFKNAVLGPLLLTGAVLTWRCRRRGRAAAELALGAAALGLLLAITPLASRCTRLTGRFCLGSVNTSCNILMGHHGDVFRFVWDGPLGARRVFGQTVNYQRGYRGELHLDFPVDDVRGNLGAAWDWSRAHPAQALWDSLRNVLDTFDRLEWPSALTALKPATELSLLYFWLLILLPAAVRLRRAAASRAPEGMGDAELLLIAPVLGIAVVVFLSVPESRYRVPYDGFLIALAAKAFADWG